MLGLAVSLAAALPAVSSPAPERVALTIYRAPYRGTRIPINLAAPDGFALITETRTVTLPRGETMLRFIGVADGIIPASAIVIGLPGGTVEKNRDARLLSPASLIDGTLGRQVTVRRTNLATGKVTQESATIVAVPDGGRGGVVMRTTQGIETWRCPGLPEKMVFDGVPNGLSAKPVLSVTTRSPRAGRVTVRLSYLASGFDWNASYVATLTPGGTTLDLFAWTTLANANAQSFPNAQVQVVAGRLNQQRVQNLMMRAQSLRLQCYPRGTTTSDLPVIQPYQRPAREMIEMSAMRMDLRAPPAMAVPAPPPPPPPAPPPPPEDLGDLKLYRVPERVTVAANAQKQVALLVQPRVAFEKLYRVAFQSWSNDVSAAAAIVLRMKNDVKDGLGVPLPTGTTTLYQADSQRRLLLGMGAIRDVAKGEPVRIAAGVSEQIVARQTIQGKQRQITATNANPFPAPLEVAIGNAGDPDYRDTSARLERIDGVQTWRVTLPANGSAGLTYTVADACRPGQLC
ncbi:DUF4139 domain-containing protein [Sphingomonas sp. ASY06-1R]|uniref:DUF4139 domain-containing protein n=1 Tax=Sphingomonas sp. ASY06-1R TaxID=3445771 RepID=UPI003FA33116